MKSFIVCLFLSAFATSALATSYPVKDSNFSCTAQGYTDEFNAPNGIFKQQIDDTIVNMIEIWLSGYGTSLDQIVSYQLFVSLGDMFEIDEEVKFSFVYNVLTTTGNSYTFKLEKVIDIFRRKAGVIPSLYRCGPNEYTTSRFQVINSNGVHFLDLTTGIDSWLDYLYKIKL